MGGYMGGLMGGMLGVGIGMGCSPKQPSGWSEENQNKAGKDEVASASPLPKAVSEGVVLAQKAEVAQPDTHDRGDTKAPAKPAEPGNPGSPGKKGGSDKPDNMASSDKTNNPKAPPKSVPAKADIPGYLLGDPPYVEGWDPEEEPCPSGNWCAPLEIAKVLANPYREGPKEGECPPALLGKAKGGVELSRPEFRGISDSPALRGTYQPWRSQKERERRGLNDLCCYHWFEYCSGRPLHTPLSSSAEKAVPDGARTRRQMPETGALEAEKELSLQELIAAQWFHDFQEEYESVASFIRAAQELHALKAPQNLIQECYAAAQDEKLHSIYCRRIAEHFGAKLPKLPPNPPQLPREADYLRLIQDTFLESCVAESIAALRARRQAELTDSPRIASILKIIEDDECRHAALGWSILGWAIRQSGAPGIARLLQSAAQLKGQFESAQTPEKWPAERIATWHRAGRLTPRECQLCAQHALDKIIDPMLRDLSGLGFDALA